MTAPDAIDYDQAEELGKGKAFPVFKQGTYRAKVLSVEHKPDNTYQGKPSPCYLMKILPLEDVLSPGKLFGTDGEERENFFEDKNGTKCFNSLFFNIAVPFAMGEKSNFGKLVRAIFPNGKPTFKTLSEYVDAELIIALSVIKKTGEGVPEGACKNKIESMSNDPTFKPKYTEAQPGFESKPVESTAKDVEGDADPVPVEASQSEVVKKEIEKEDIEIEDEKEADFIKELDEAGKEAEKADAKPEKDGK